MNGPPHPHPRDLFISPPKRLEVGFYTSSLDKFLQARSVLYAYGLMVRHYLGSQEPYFEDYSQGKHELLTQAITEVKTKLKVNSLFFVEDTSVRIEALSTATVDIPGLSIKEWFKDMQFSELDKLLRKKGNDRRASVISDIALHVPELNRPIFFHGCTDGVVADTPPEFVPSDMHPWLRPDTFNGWFIPEDSTKRLGEMSREESWEYDFRIRSLAAMVDRLEEYAALLNVKTPSYSITRRPLRSDPQVRFRFDTDPLLVVVGPVCSGKTTFKEFVCADYDYHALEASGVVRLLAEEDSLESPTAFGLAKLLLDRHGPDCVARNIVSRWGGTLDERSVITGFRTIEEIEYIRSRYPDCKVIAIEANERTRFQRHLDRARQGSVKTLDEFRERDREQRQLGLMGVVEDIADLRIQNEGTMEEYHQQIASVVYRRKEPRSGVLSKRHPITTILRSRLFRCLASMYGAMQPLTIPKIAAGTACNRFSTIHMGNDEKGGEEESSQEAISERHTNWVLRDVPELARRIDAKGSRVCYELLPAGLAYIRSIRRMAGENEDGVVE